MNRQCLNSLKPKIEENSIFDVLVIGSGIAGLYTALNISSNLKVLIVTKDNVYETNSNLAQGGIAAAMDKSDYDSHIADTLKAGCYINNYKSVRIIVEEGKENVDQLVDLGVQFDRNEDGNLKSTREGGHSNYRVLHAKDATGREIIRALVEEVKKRNNIEVYENSFVVDLITKKNKCFGALIKRNSEITPYISKYTILATGGIGQLYKNSTNSLIASGDGIAMAKRAGATIMDMEFIQFHPTALYRKGSKRNFLISEALRGEGGILRNEDGIDFMKEYHELMDLAPRDIVARAIINEMNRFNKPYVYLDATHMEEAYIKQRFPNIFNECKTYGIDMTKEYIPVCPVQHYLMGGIKTDTLGKTSIDSLFACGETAKTGSHGANRLASNSLLEAIVFAKRIGNEINSEYNKYDFSYDVNDLLESVDYKKNNCNEDNYEIFHSQLKNIMTENVFIHRSYNQLLSARKDIEILKESLNTTVSSSISYFTLYNMITTAEIIIDAALSRNESIGSHNLLDKGDI